MLSAQIDELRKAAEYYDDSEVASIMRYAADTIWQLRDDLQRTNAENAVLRTQLADVTESMGRVEERCAKLRKLADGLRYCANEAYGMCARVPVGGERPFTCCPLYDFDSREYGCEKLMRELGIEVTIHDRD